MAAERKFLSLEKKCNAIKLLDNGMPAYKFAKLLGVGKTQIQNLLKRKAQVMSDVENNVPLSTTRRRHCTGNEEINDLTYEWYKDAVSRSIPVTGPMLQTTASEFAKQLEVDTFKASKGWLQSFNTRNSISFGTMSGEMGDVKEQTVSDRKKNIPNLCEVYEEKDIFNMDESGLFFKDTLRKTLHFQSQDCTGGKRSKDHITIASMLRGKLKALVTGKSQNVLEGLILKCCLFITTTTKSHGCRAISMKITLKQ